MALIQMTLLSRCLMRTVPVTVVLPADKMSDFTDPLPPEKKFPSPIAFPNFSCALRLFLSNAWA